MSNNESPKKYPILLTPSRPPAGSDPFVFTPAPRTPTSSTPEFVLSLPRSPMPSDPVEIDKWYDRHGLPGNQEEYFRHCGVLYSYYRDALEFKFNTPATPCPASGEKTWPHNLNTRKRRDFNGDSESQPAKRQRQSQSTQKQLSTQLDIDAIMGLLRENLEETQGVRRDIAILSTKLNGTSASYN